MKTRWIAAGLVILAVTLGAMACNDNKDSTTKKTPAKTTSATRGAETPTGGNAQSEVTATLVEYKISPDVSSAPAGQVKFTAKNIGATEHELVIFKTDLGATALPTKADGSVDEEGAGVTLVDEADGIQPNDQGEVTADLDAGSYVLVCNIVQEADGQTVNHYAKGMAVEFTVTQ